MLLLYAYVYYAYYSSSNHSTMNTSRVNVCNLRAGRTTTLEYSMHTIVVVCIL